MAGLESEMEVHGKYVILGPEGLEAVESKKQRFELENARSGRMCTKDNRLVGHLEC